MSPTPERLIWQLVSPAYNLHPKPCSHMQMKPSTRRPSVTCAYPKPCTLFIYADEAVIQKAKRVKLLACHPDKVGSSVKGAGHAVVRITSAQAVLGDSRSRARYDAELRAAAAAAATANAASSSNSSGAYTGGLPPKNSRTTSSRYPLYPNHPGILLPTRWVLCL